MKALWRGKIGKHRIAIFYSSPQAKDLQIISRELAAKRLVPLVDSTWTLEDASTALARVASHHAHGKVVITP
ncbi:zinc-binding dehydrogenase [Timonella sp. A28]|uniref:zinc-binding dehydrogenase n=1 Tax=Timonella sp. A28 TaxID=3442640 RepID=UPI003EBE4279